MELRTTINVTDAIDPDILFDQCRVYAGILTGRAATDLNWHAGQSPDGRQSLFLDQEDRLPFTLSVIHRSGQMVLSQAEADELGKNGCGDPYCQSDHDVEPCYVVVNMGCPLDYTDAQRDWNAGDLLAALMRNICDFLDGAHLDYRWWENVTATFHDDIDHADELPGAVERFKAAPPQNPLAILLSRLFGIG